MARLALITSSYPCGSGESFLTPEMEELVTSGHEVLVIPAWPRGPVSQAAEGVAYAGIDDGILSGPIIRGAIRETARGWRCPPMFSARKAGASVRNVGLLPKALRIADALRAWRPDHIHAYWGSAPASVAWLVGDRLRVPWSLTFHRWDIYDDNFVGRKLAAADFSRVISQRGASDLVSMAPNAPRPRVLHLGVRVPNAPAPWRAGRVKRALVSASLTPLKGHGVLLTALGMLKSPLMVDVAGDGPLRADLERQARKLCISRSVRFLGQVPHRLVLESLSAGEYDFAVLPSLELSAQEHEGIPVALMEAMAVGRPVIGTRTGSIPELVREERLVVPPGDSVALRDAIERLVANDKELRRLGEDARRVIRNDFDARKTAAELSSWIFG